MLLVIENKKKYSRNFDKKQINNTKGLIEGRKLPARPKKISEKL